MTRVRSRLTSLVAIVRGVCRRSRTASSETAPLSTIAQDERRDRGCRSCRPRATIARTAGMSDVLDAAAERVGHQVLGEVSRKTSLWLSSAARRLGRAVQRVPSYMIAGRVDRHAVVLDAPAAGDVEVLERQAERIDHPVARRARRVLAVLFHPLAHRQQLAAAGRRRSPRAPARSAAAAAAASRAALP